MGDIAKLARSIQRYADTHSAATIGDPEKRDRLKDVQTELVSLGWAKSFMGMSLVAGDKKATIKFSPDHAVVSYTSGRKSTIEFGDDPANALADRIDTEVRKLLGAERIIPDMRQAKIDAVANTLHQQFDYTVKVEDTIIRATKFIPETKIKSTFTVALDIENGYYTFIYSMMGRTNIVTKEGNTDTSKLRAHEIVDLMHKGFEVALTAVIPRDKKQEQELVKLKERKLQEDRDMPGFANDIDADILYENWKKITGNKALLQSFRQRLVRERASEED